MKKVIGILMIMFCITSVFGQHNLGSQSFIEYRHWSEWSNMAHFYTESGNDKFLYMLAYEPNFERGMNDGMKRKVYLYCVKTTASKTAVFREHYNWIRVSDVVFEAYYIDDVKKEYDFHLYNKKTQNKSHSSVEVKGNTVIFTVDVTEQRRGKNHYTRSYQEAVVLKIDPKRQSFFNYYVKK